MLKHSDKILIGLAIVVFALAVLVRGKIAIQPTGSLARGLYLKSGIQGPLKNGEIVSVSFKKEVLTRRPETYPMPKSLPWHTFIKVIAAVSGDRIDVSDKGLFINDKYCGPVFNRDSKNRPLMRVVDGEYILEKDWYFVTTPHPRSFDSRYYGPAHISQLKSAKPLWLLPWDNNITLKKGMFMDRENAKSAVEATIKSMGLESWFKEKNVTDIIVNPDSKLIIDKLEVGRIITGEMIAPVKIEAFLRTCASYVGEIISYDQPSLECDLDFLNYARLQGLVYPAVSSPCFCIRCRAIHQNSLNDLVEKRKMLTVKQANILKKAVFQKHDIIISGIASSGKTSLLNSLLPLISSERTISIEDTRELNTECIEDKVPLRLKNSIASAKNLLKATLRLRPDRILVGELRDGETAWTLLKAVSTGHGGSLSTIHAMSGIHTLSRLEQLILETKLTHTPKHLIGEVIDIIVHIEFDAKAGVRKVADITRVNGFDGNKYIVETIG